MNWLKRLTGKFYPINPPHPGSKEEMVLSECIDSYRRNMEKVIPETDDDCLISLHISNAVMAYDEFRSKLDSDLDCTDFEINIQETFVDILDSNWTKNEEFCQESLNEAENRILNIDCSDDNQSEADSQEYWTLMKKIQKEYSSMIGDLLFSKMKHVRLEYLDERQEVDYEVLVEQWKKQTDSSKDRTSALDADSTDDATSQADDSRDDDSTRHVTEDAANSSNSTADSTSPGLSEEVFCKQLKLQMTWGRLLVFWNYWIDCRKETIHLLRGISEQIRELYQPQDHQPGDPSDIHLDWDVNDFPKLSLQFVNVVNKDIRCYKVLLRKLKDFLELVKRDEYLNAFHAKSIDIFLSISLFQQDISTENDQTSRGLEICERVLDREDQSMQGTAWLIEGSSRSVVHLTDLFRKLDEEGRFNAVGLDDVVDSLEREDQEMESMFGESLQRFLEVSSAVSDAFEALRDDIRRWLSKRNETIGRLRDIAEQLNKTTRDVAISQTVGSSVGVVGGLVAIGGLVLSPFTLGLSLIPSAIAGGVIAGAGALTAIGSTVAEIIIDKSLVERATTCLAEDKRLTDSLADKIRDFNETSSLLLKYIPQDELENFITVATCQHSSTSPDLASTPEGVGPRLGITVTRLVTVGGKAIAMPVTKMVIAGTVATSRVVAMAVAHGIAAVGIGLDIANIVLAAIKLGKGAKSENAIKLEEAVDDLETGKREICGIYLDDRNSDS